MNWTQPLAHLSGKFIFQDGTGYDLDDFNIGFMQEVDSKGQPQHETRGGIITIVLSQQVGDALCEWGKDSYKKCNGTVIFETEMGSPPLKVEFFNAYCVNMSEATSAYSGTFTRFVISPERILMNDIEHDNFWPK